MQGDTGFRNTVIAVIVLVLAAGVCGLWLFSSQQKEEVVLHMLDRVPIAIQISEDATTANPKGLVINLDDGSCIPKSCKVTTLPGKSALAQIFTDDSDKAATGQPMALALQIRMYPPKDTTVMYGLPAFELVAIAQVDNFGMPTGPNLFSGEFEVDGVAVAPPVDFMGWWNSLKCRVTFMGTTTSCDQVGYYPDQNGYWIFPVVDPATVPTIQVNILKLSSNGALALFPIESEEVTLDDIRYIAGKMPQAARLLKIYGAAEYLIPSVTP